MTGSAGGHRMNTHSIRTPGQRGMSLIEIILIVVILGIVLVPLTRLSRANLRNVATYSVIEKAQMDIQSVMERVLAKYTATTTGYDSVKTLWNGKSGLTNSGQFTYSVACSADMVQNGITYSVVTVTVSGGGLPSNMVLTSWISKQ
jgi:Tfp pilus assembly protein PilV